MRPKICVPIVAPIRDGIIRETKQIAKLPVEMVEWRIDFYAGFGGSGFPHPCRVAYSFRFPLYFRACPFHHPFMRDTLKRNINH